MSFSRASATLCEGRSLLCSTCHLASQVSSDSVCFCEKPRRCASFRSLCRSSPQDRQACTVEIDRFLERRWQRGQVRPTPHARQQMCYYFLPTVRAHRRSHRRTRRMLRGRHHQVSRFTLYVVCIGFDSSDRLRRCGGYLSRGISNMDGVWLGWLLGLQTTTSPHSVASVLARSHGASCRIITQKTINLVLGSIDRK